MEDNKKTPDFKYSLFVMFTVFAFIMIPVAVINAKIQVMFMMSWLIAIPLCMKLGYSYNDLQKGLIKFVSNSLVPVLIMLAIGSLIGAWCASGTVAYITSMGLQIISPKYFLATAFIVSLISSFFTGTSFGTCGTIGVALMGVAAGMGISLPLAASAIISAAIIGDGFSPLSSTPNVIAGSAGVPVLDSVKYQAPMVISVSIIAFLYYLIFGIVNSSSGIADTTSINDIIQGINATYNMNILCVVPIVVVFTLLILKFPSIPSILIGSFTGLLVAVFVQGLNFKIVIASMWGGFVLKSNNQLINSLFSRGGISGMAETSLLIMFAFGLFGILNECKILETLVNPLASKIKSQLSGVICVIILGFLSNFSSSSSFSQVFTASVMKPVFEKANLNKLDLARAATVGCLGFSLYVPFTVMASTTSGFLGVDPVTMMRYHVLPIIYLIVILVITIFNLGKKTNKESKESLIN